MEQIHGHEVMQMLINQDEPKSKLDFKKEVETRFGFDSKFYTCSAENLSVEQLIEFLDKKGKFFYDDDGKISTSPGKMCSHS
jgi:probable metal-binding protein